MKLLTPLFLFAFSLLHAAPLSVFMFDLGTGAVYDGTNSPAHAAGAVALDNTEWIKAGSGTVNHTFTDGTTTTNFGRSHGNAVDGGIDFSLSPSGSQQDSSTVTGTGIFGTQLTESYFRGRDNNDGRNVGWAISGLGVGEYDIYVVLHNPNSLASENNVGIGVLSDAPPTTSGTALPWNNSGLTQTTLAANPRTDIWEAGTNYALTRVTVNNASEYLYVIGGASGVNQSAMSAIQIVAIPEPGTLALMGIALGALVLFRRRR